MNIHKKLLKPRRSKKAGLPAGSINAISTPKSESSKINLHIYDKEHYEKFENLEAEALITKINGHLNPDQTASDKVFWLNIDGHGQPLIMKQICEALNIHALVLEDIITTGQRPKTEDYQNYSYTVLQSITPCCAGSLGSEPTFDIEQISLILGANFLVSFQEKEGDAFKNIAVRLENASSKLRQSGADFLSYTIIDGIVDQYFSSLEILGDLIDQTETAALETPSPDVLTRLYSLKRAGLELRRAVWPLRELVLNLDRLESKFISSATKLYLRDVYSHIIEIIDSIEIYREMLGGLFELYLSSVNSRLNEVIKVLTVITTIFMPLTFLAGVYGMNFKYMPELEYQYAYPAVLAGMLVLAVVMFVFFRFKRWI